MTVHVITGILLFYSSLIPTDGTVGTMQHTSYRRIFGDPTLLENTRTKEVHSPLHCATFCSRHTRDHFCLTFHMNETSNLCTCGDYFHTSADKVEELHIDVLCSHPAGIQADLKGRISGVVV